MHVFLQTLLDGLMLGGLYALAASGFSLIFGVMGILNLAHGAFLVLGAYVGLQISQSLSIEPILTLPAVVVVLFAAGALFQRYLVQLTVDRGGLVASLLVTFGVSLIIHDLLAHFYGPGSRTIVSSYAYSRIEFGGLVIGLSRLVPLVVSIVLILALHFMLARSRLGREMRAASQQIVAARLCGINVRRVFALTFGIASAYAGVAGVLVGTVLPFSPNSETYWTISAFVVVVLGGAKSPAGTLLGGLLLGILNTMTAQFISPLFTSTVMFLVLVLMLLVRPQGILGHAAGATR
ncbi:branched-chain amino acid ABC transporter permease [Corticibacterium sp. UT-5YL-CI-8]|nr:branched-chain amino acid ABC transporter permease [Tianweitania sp. UT-5YL-CI-8]